MHFPHTKFKKLGNSSRSSYYLLITETQKTQMSSSEGILILIVDNPLTLDDSNTPPPFYPSCHMLHNRILHTTPHERSPRDDQGLKSAPSIS